jgi:hypothetical protein
MWGGGVLVFVGWDAANACGGCGGRRESSMFKVGASGGPNMNARRRTAIIICLAAALGTAYAGSDRPTPNGVQASGDAVDARTASLVANQHFDRYGMADAYSVLQTRSVSPTERGDVLYHCVDLSPTGYVIVPADTALPPVIAYSFTSPAPLAAGTPLADLLAWDLTQRLTHADALQEAAAREICEAWQAVLDPTAGGASQRAFQRWPPAGSTPTGGWLRATWNQSAPYNDLCPMDLVNGQRSVAGCPSIAMAQILDFHGRLNGTRLDDSDDYYHNYAGNRFWIDDAHKARSFPSFPELNAHLDGLFDDYFYGTSPATTRLAALVFACGVAAEQVYNAGGSGTFGVSQAMAAYQRFGCSGAVLLDDTATDLHDRLAQNMKAGLPAHFAVVDPAWSYGHNLVIDGYNTDGYFHLNFGWSGSYNGWYDIPSEMPISLTVIEGVILDIMSTPCAPFDCTCDGAVDEQDLAYCEDCFMGPVTMPAWPGCAAFDADGDQGGGCRARS